MRMMLNWRVSVNIADLHVMLTRRVSLPWQMLNVMLNRRVSFLPAEIGFPV